MQTHSVRRILLLLVLSFVTGTSFAQGVVVVAGGGREGDQGDTSSWSYKLYRKLIDNGDRNSDGVIKVAIITTLLEVNDSSWYVYAESATSASPPGLGLTHAQAIAQAQADDLWLVNYFQWIGTSAGVFVQASNVEVTSLSQANSAAIVGYVANADVIFIKGGDQGEYYDKWNNTLLETHIRTVVQSRSGAIGGTSAGAMSQAQYCFSGGADMISADVLADAKSVLLNDVSQPGTSGIHTDFLSFVPGAVIEAHYTQRARMGRLLGILARAVADSGNHNILGIGVDQKTGIVVKNGVAEVMGNGAVDFFKESADTILRRDTGRPLFYTQLILDRLTEGWKFDLTNRVPIVSPLPSGVTAVNYTGDGAANSGSLSISGSTEADANRFDRLARYAPNDYSLPAGTASPFIKNALGFTDSGNTANRGAKQETLFRALFDLPQNLGFLIFNGATVSRTSAAPDTLAFGGTLATIVIDGKTGTYKSLAPTVSSYAISGGSLRAAGLTNLRVHVLAESSASSRGISFDSRLHTLIGAPGGSGGGGGSLPEVEPNDTRSNAQDISGAGFPVSLVGAVSTSSDIDHYKLTLASGGALAVDLALPANVDYDIYLLSASGAIEARSTHAGNGLAESIRFNNSSSGTNTYYVKVLGYAGANSSSTYTLGIAK
jgi:cyanophycinase